MISQITAALRNIEARDSVRIIFACESGSRAWGFPSADSDYDVRFIYLRRQDWYCSIDVEDRSDVIELPILDELDVSGWDLRKALKLLKKSNPPLLEWLNSPIVYLELSEIVKPIRELIPAYYSPVACGYHYLHMAQGNYRDYLRSELVWIKKYFYVLRPLLAIKWIEKYAEAVPMEFGVLVANILDQGELRREIEALIAAKASGAELDRGPKIPIISEFIENELARLEADLGHLSAPKTSFERLNEVFRFALEKAW